MNTTAKTLSALLLGAAMMTPAFAQNTAAPSANNGNSATAQTADAAPSAAPTTPVASSTTTSTSTNMAANNSSQANDNSANASSSTQMAMNTTGNAAGLSSVPDTEKKYSRSTRAKDFRKEAQVTAELNQKEASMNGTSQQ